MIDWGCSDGFGVLRLLKENDGAGLVDGILYTMYQRRMTFNP
jgi:hypothetical protein